MLSLLDVQSKDSPGVIECFEARDAAEIEVFPLLHIVIMLGRASFRYDGTREVYRFITFFEAPGGAG